MTRPDPGTSTDVTTGGQHPQGGEGEREYLDAADEPTLRELEEVTKTLEQLVDRIEELADGLRRDAEMRPS